MKIPDKIKKMMQLLNHNGFDSYIIGGAVRDYYFDVEPHDYDLFTNATGKEILSVFPNGKVLGGDERQEKILTVIVDGVEISQFRSNGNRTETGKSFEEHIKTCDLTINAMACDINGKIIDLANGEDDLKSRTIRFVGDGVQRIKEDPLRILRAVRFACKYNFALDAKSYLDMKDNVSRLLLIPNERILEELKKILMYDNAIRVLRELNILYFLEENFLSIKNMDGGDKHDETVEEHVENAFRIACGITNKFENKVAALYHDIGKGLTKEEVEGKITFHGHEAESEKIFLAFAKKYKFSNSEIKFIAFLIKHHMFGYHMESIKTKTLIKFFNKMESAGVDILDFVTMMYCDHQGNMKKPRIKFKDFIQGNYFYNQYHSLKNTNPFKLTDLDINGNDLINLGYKGKDVGIKLNELFDLVNEGKLINRKDKLMEVLIK